MNNNTLYINIHQFTNISLYKNFNMYANLFQHIKFNTGLITISWLLL